MSHLSKSESQKIFSSKEAKDNFGRLLDTAQQEPVTIQKKGRSVAVVLSLQEYKRFEALEDAYWGGLAERAQKEGSLGTDESEKFLGAILNAED